MENFKGVISRMEMKDDGSREFREHFWHTIVDSLKKLNEKELGFIDQDFIAKFLLDSLQRYGCSNTNIPRDIIRRYAIQLDASFMQSSSMHSFFTVPFLVQNIHFSLLEGDLDHVIYYKDGTHLVDSMHLALENADQDFTICLIKYGLYLPGKLDLRGVTKYVDLFLKIW